MCCGGNNTNGNFTYIAFASDLNGANFSVNRNAGNMRRCFQAIYVSNIQLDINSPTFQNYFSNRWFNLCDREKDMFIIEFQKFLIFKVAGNLDLLNMQVGDIVQGYFSATKFIKAVYLGGELDEIASFNLLEELDF